MDLSNMRAYLADWWNETGARAEARRDSQGALLELYRLYQSFTDDQRPLADVVLADWLTAPSSAQRYDALAAIEEFAIRSALPMLQEREIQLRQSDSPEDRFELQKIRRAISAFDDPGH